MMSTKYLQQKLQQIIYIDDIDTAHGLTPPRHLAPHAIKSKAEHERRRLALFSERPKRAAIDFLYLPRPNMWRNHGGRVNTRHRTCYKRSYDNDQRSSPLSPVATLGPTFTCGRN
ncbi:hypothetical protein EVAR_40936_1 [Eumeta japonica]|uniref:Uncharacterized protein n=1 Tax=Eumeta variegata TaxID=151549 RepID=A0A4C1X7Y0_EUMVA|nr:hypothetical protein EVAR_40936_1 [Eumeta japonica]